MLYCACRLIALCILKIYATCACVCGLIALCIQKIYAMYACVCRLRIGAAAPSRTPLVRLDRVIVGLVSFLELLEVSIVK